ncbi:hypothetical protein DOTSEDRAFT_22534 [Dothistroma septosporum NZE10]|uniref:Uncharacterized protein n=1 Tax=Dothistroma septosporum (strain NZE10 / CBS 128990) TaxID=675120 RepID=N1PSN9_DOTSN|nr:hypothetical protein DOTSEDRAFT_22534 [Dothistroma septosporum NZE10]
MPARKTAPTTGQLRPGQEERKDVREALRAIVGETLYLRKDALMRASVYAELAHTLARLLREEDNEALDTIGYYVSAAWELLYHAQEAAPDEEEDAPIASAPEERDRSRHTGLAAPAKRGPRKPKKASSPAQDNDDARIAEVMPKKRGRSRKRPSPENKDRPGANDEQTVSTVPPKRKRRGRPGMNLLSPPEDDGAELDDAEDEKPTTSASTQNRGQIPAPKAPQPVTEGAKSTSTARVSGRNKRKANDADEKDAEMTAPPPVRRSKRARNGLVVDGNTAMGGSQVRAPVTWYRARNGQWWEELDATGRPDWAVDEKTV